jgi:2-oxoglutarate ferredoxin oxidoreductase subunit gamma
MSLKIMIAGFGGQGIILTGKILAYCAMKEGKEVTSFASYGAEMRGGTCSSAVVISDTPISSPVIDTPDIALILNQPSKNKFEKKIIKNGRMILNVSMISEGPKREDLVPCNVDASKLAEKAGSIKATNMVMLGALVKATGVIKLKTLLDSIPEMISARNQSMIGTNIKAIQSGYDAVS